MLTQLSVNEKIIEIDEIISLTEYRKNESKGKLIVNLLNGQHQVLSCDDITCVKIKKHDNWLILWDHSFGGVFNYETFYHVANLGKNQHLNHSVEMQEISYLCNYLDLIGSNEAWSLQKRNLFLDQIIKTLVPNLQVVETGCRYGIWTHAAYVHGAKKAVGIDFDTNCLIVCDYICRHLNVSYERCHFINANACNFDYSQFDLVLCLGVMYNVSDEDKNKILSKMLAASSCLVEFWCIDSSDPNPKTSEYIALNGWTQYMPNKAQAELFLNNNGYKFTDLTPLSFQNNELENRYYLCHPKQIMFQ